jgi:hypothetical protein
MSGPTLPEAPYKGLVPYGEGDAPFFFGRDAEREIITANLLASRLTVFYGASGVGKSSVLRAGVAHHLRARSEQERAERGRAEFAVVVFRDWRDDPVSGLAAEIRRTVAPLLPEGAAPPSPDLASLVETLRVWSEALDGDLLIILDQFEEYFLYHGQEDGPGTFAVEFPRAVNRRDLRVSFLVSLREDALAQLDRFKGRIPNLFDNYLRIRHLDREAGHEAIEKPLDRFNELRGDAEPVSSEPALVEEVLDQVQSGRVLLGEAGQGGIGGLAAAGAGGEEIETPYLQLVMTRLWEKEMRAGSRVLRLSTLRELGGAERIVRTHLDQVMDALSPQEQETAVRIFRHLVTPGGTKIALTASDLAYFTELPEPALEEVLRTLSRGDGRILRSADAGYEIFHDVLAPAVLDWRRRFLEKKRRRQRQLVSGAAVLIGAVALLVLVVFAVSQRYEAQLAEQRADSVESALVRFAREREAQLAQGAGGDSVLVDSVVAPVDTLSAPEVQPLVYVQFRGGVSRNLVDELRAELDRLGMLAPGAERITQSSFTSHVSYFHEEDSALATTLAGITRRFFADRNCTLDNDIPLRPLAALRSRVQRGQVEIWVNTNCP